jgi:hypothetical protein
MPDIGHIICGWGQPLLRGKDWNGDNMSISGGIMAWVLYAPEDGSAPRCVEGWLPMQMKWNLPPTQHDGVIRCDMRLRGVDARILSARKMMIRAQISVMGEALEPVQVECCTHCDVPDHVQLYQKTYPVLLQSEAGEVAIQVDEDVTISEERPNKIISCTLEAKLAEQKVVGSRVIFRGDCLVHLVYFGADDVIHSRDLSVPFAQYAQLDQDYDKQANAEVMITASALEPELTQEGLRLKCTLVCQYTVLDQHMIECAQDAYSTKHDMEYTLQNITLPALLDRRTERRCIQQKGPGEAGQIIDTSVYYEQPVVRRNGSNVDIQLPGAVQILSRDANGTYHGNTIRFADQWSICAEDQTSLQLVAAPADRPRAVSNADGIEIQCDVDMRLCTTVQQTISQIGMIEIGKEKSIASDRPSLILRRPGDASLWDLAKLYGSTVEQICHVNAIEDAPQKDKILLIPIS